MQYHVHIQPRDQSLAPGKLIFTLDRNPLVDIWLECVETQFTVPWTVNHLQWCSSFATEATLAQALADIEQSRAALGLDAGLDINALHLLFHSYYDDENPADYEWDLLNRRIHHLEEQQSSLASPNYQRAGFNCVIADEETNLVEQRPIPDNLRHFWAHIPKSGDLLLGYYTLGKTIYNCVKDNDQECVRQRMVRPQQMVSTENLCGWSNVNLKINNAGNRHTEVLKWVRYNKLEEFIDLSLPENQFHGQPRLGQYSGDMSLDEINRLLSGGKVVFAELLD